jgi:predicted XRE-type DNA-binding protein
MRRRIGRKGGARSAVPDRNPATPAQVVEIKRALAFQLERALNEEQITKTELARRMETSRSQLNRLLDPATESMTLEALARAAQAMGRRVRVEFI